MSSDTNLHHQTGSRRLTTIVAVDVCDYSKMSETDELAAIRLMDEIFDLSQKLVSRFNGRIFKTIADATLVEFPSTQDAIFFTIALRENISEQTQWQQRKSVETRIGIHVGDIVDRPDGDILGHGVNVAVRLQESAPRNGIIASSNVINLLPDNLKLNITHAGKASLKNIDQPINTFLIQQTKNRLRKPKLRRVRIVKVFFGVVLLGLAVWSFVHFKGSSLKQNEISSVAVSATLHNLRQSPYPISDMFAALITTSSFDGALNLLIETYDKKNSNMSDENKINLLHQIASLAVNRNTPKAEKAYRKVLSMKRDPEALLQLAIILRQRGDIVQARDFLQRAETATEDISYLPDRINLRIQIETAVLNGRYGPNGNSLDAGSTTELRSAEKLLSQIAVSELSKSHPDIRLRASYHALLLRFMRLYQVDGSNLNPEKFEIYSRIIDELKSVIEEQNKHNFLYDLSESYTTLSLIQNVVLKYSDSIYSLEQILAIEESLVRPSKTISTHANLAYANVASSSDDDERLDQAEYHVQKVRDISVVENRANREYYNLYILALVENKRGNQDQACSYFDSARLMWPQASLPKGFLPKLNKDLGCNFYDNAALE